nr:MAG TPA: hypothetical protein [Caudoviricetes sp.]
MGYPARRRGALLALLRGRRWSSGATRIQT